MEGVLSSSQVSGLLGTEEQRNDDSLEAGTWDIGPHTFWSLDRQGSLGLAAMSSLPFLQGIDGQYETLVQPCSRVLMERAEG